MREHGVKNFVYSSSSTVYGNPQFLPLTEDHPTDQGCTNPYGKSKYFVEEILKDVCLADSVSNVLIVILMHFVKKDMVLALKGIIYFRRWQINVK